MIIPKHSISGAIEGNVVDVICIGELEARTVVAYHYATYSAARPVARCSVFGLYCKKSDTTAIKLCSSFVAVVTMICL